MKRTKRYDDGGEVDALESANQSKQAQELAGEAILKGMRDADIDKPVTFKEAFAAARRAGDKTFEFGGKKYTTEMATAKPAKVMDTGDEMERLAARNPKPKETGMGPRLTYPKAGKSPYSYADDLAYAEKKAKEARAAEIGEMKKRPVRLSKNVFEPQMGSIAGNYAKGGMTASKRADGIAQRGKTKGKMC